ncbi:MAG: hypothetical protein PWQ55_2050 [Chloroflexota bacterium]|nr:hypothetical protein [Chloroflexota bacterium]
MKANRQIKQYLSILLVQAVAFYLLSHLPGLQFQSLTALVSVGLVYVLVLLVFWWSFIHFFSYLPVWLYPVVSFALAGILAMTMWNLVPGIVIANVGTAIWMILILTGVNSMLAGIFSLNFDQIYSRQISRRFIARHEKPESTSVPGFLFLEIDGLGEAILREAIQAGRVPTLKRWIDAGTHRLTRWETDYSSQTCAMQAGILFGNNDEIPAFRWWDRQNQRTVLSGYFPDALAIEERVSSGQGLLAGDGVSRANMFSGDAVESMLTVSTVLKRERETGPDFYAYLVNPFIIGDLITSFLAGVITEWVQSLIQRFRKNQIIIRSRNFMYGFIRAAEGRLLPRLTTLLLNNDMLRGIPAIYATYSGYDSISHFAGAESHEAMQTLTEIDHEFSRLENLLPNAPRPYHIIVLSDHGQSTGGPFSASSGLTLEKLIEQAIAGNQPVIQSADIEESWGRINTFLSDSIQANTRLARVLRTMVRSKTHDGMVEIGAKRNKQVELNPEQDADALIVYGSGSAGLVYFKNTPQRVDYETIQERYPDLLLTLLNHPEVGFLLVRSQENGDLVMGKNGVYFLENDSFEGENPLADYNPNAAQWLKRESAFSNCADIVINTKYDPQTARITSFENQVSHHGGLGGAQNYPFLLYPAELPIEGGPLLGAESIYRLLKGWRTSVQTPSNEIAGRN